MLMVLVEPARTLVLTFAYTGLRKGEVLALRWENVRDGAIWVEQSAWRGCFTEPKSVKSKAPVPLIAPLAKALEGYRRGETEGLVFAGLVGKPLNVDNLVRRVIRPAFQRAGIEWHGWHAFRRGLATNLKQLGVDDKTIQAIMRHADYSTTLNSYVKSVPESVQEAMERYERLICTQYALKPEVKPV
jgi:integrase